LFCSPRANWHRLGKIITRRGRLRTGLRPQADALAYNPAVASPRYDYGSATSVDAQAVGQPGQRRFRLLVRSANGDACLWMEKEQLAGVGDWFHEMGERLDRARPTDEPDVEPLPSPDHFDVDFRAVQIALGFEEERGRFAFHAFDQAEAQGGGEPAFRCFVSRGQARYLVGKIQQLMASGRPICPLCQLPMDPGGHTCPRTNGHSPNVRLR
jgi:uncharacterized repeat protein (TIGR03847 family)